MKINPIMNKNYAQYYNNTNKVAAPAKETPRGGIDQVSLSSEVRSFSKTMTAVKDQIDVRAPEEKNRIADIKSRVRQGTYEIDSKLVAEKMIDSLSK